MWRREPNRLERAMSENSKLETDKIQSLSRELDALPPARTTLTKRKVVALLASDIQRARDKGYTLKEIVRHLQNRGFDLSYDTLRNALPRQKKSRSGKKKPRAVAADGSRMRIVAPSNAPGIRDVSPAKSPRPAPDAPERIVVPPGASSVPIGGGRFVPAPDSEVL